MLNHVMAGNTLGPLMGHSVKSQETLYYAAYVFYNQARYIDAMRIFTHLLIIDHLDRRYHNGLAACHQMQRRYEDALKYYGIASMFDLTDPEPVIHMAECHLALGHRADARTSLEYALAQARGNDVHHDFTGRIEAMLAFLDSEPATTSDTTPENATPARSGAPQENSNE